MHSPVSFAVLTLTLYACGNNARPHASRSLRDYARDARQRGSREAFVPYAFDEEEGEMLSVPTFEGTLGDYLWIVGELIEEKTVTFAQVASSTEPDSIFAIYRIRVERRFAMSKDVFPAHPLLKRCVSLMPPRPDEILVLKSGGAITVDGCVAEEARIALLF